jgi:hypothetical protein
MVFIFILMLGPIRRAGKKFSSASFQERLFFFILIFFILIAGITSYLPRTQIFVPFLL